MISIQDLYAIYQQHPVVTTDSRKCPPGSLFFALKGESFDGNLFAAKALEAGCAAAIVDDARVVPADADADKHYLLVDDVLQTLQHLAAYHRQHFGGPVIQITGTNGKTTTKELVAAVLGRKYKVLYTQGNLNNHIGVPLTLLRLNPRTDEIAVIETGANHPGEIALLTRIVQPDYGLITNVGHAHIEGFGSFEGVKDTKAELYDYLLTKSEAHLFVDASNPHLVEMLEKRGCDINSEKCKRYTSDASTSSAPCIVGSVTACDPFVEVTWSGRDEKPARVGTRLVGVYNLSNLLSAICVGQYFGISTEDISQALSDYTPGLGRSQYQRIGTNDIIIDAYNANITSMTAALENFGHLQHEHKMLILGGMKELGAESHSGHVAILDLVDQLGADAVWLVGEEFGEAAQGRDAHYRLFDTVEAVKAVLRNTPPTHCCILIKGSNSTRLHELPTTLEAL